jgi:hypothetical protein
VRKAAIVCVQAPLLLYLSVVSILALRSQPEQIWLMLPALLAMPTLSLLPGLTGEYLPLSAAARTGGRSLQIAIMFSVMVPAGVLGVVAHLAQEAGLLWLLLGVELVALIALHALLRKIVARRSTLSKRRMAGLMGT